VNTDTLNAYQAQGKQLFLQTQLNPFAVEVLPTDVSSVIEDLNDDNSPPKILVQAFLQQRKYIRSLPIDEKSAADRELGKQNEEKLQKLAQRHFLRALYSPAQLKEQMVWFWLNHFNVFKNKSPVVKLCLPDYEENAIRPHALGKFRDLLLATLRHPAMLIYLDNVQNAANKINENYARELLELHTLGIDGGYTQQDVQELSRILTGVGVNWTDTPPKMKPALKPYYVYAEGFEFNPARHDFGQKVFLGNNIAEQGFAEVEKVVDILVKHPATARFISQKLAFYFVSDTPSPELIAQMANTFQKSEGDIGKTLQTLFTAAEFNSSLGKKISDPLHYVLATTRFVHDGQTITNTRPLINSLTVLGQPIYAHLTPDGYGLTEKDWVSLGQLIKRFQVAKNIANYNPKLFEESEDDFTFGFLFQIFSDKQNTLPNLSTPLFFSAIEPLLSKQTKAALAKAKNTQEWNSLLLSAPEFLYR
jgi:uncharacterized protein (DUF1800 family)